MVIWQAVTWKVSGMVREASEHVPVDLNFNETAVCTSACRAFQEDARSKGSESGMSWTGA